MGISVYTYVSICRCTCVCVWGPVLVCMYVGHICLCTDVHSVHMFMCVTYTCVSMSTRMWGLSLMLAESFCIVTPGHEYHRTSLLTYKSVGFPWFEKEV